MTSISNQPSAQFQTTLQESLKDRSLSVVEYNSLKDMIAREPNLSEQMKAQVTGILDKLREGSTTFFGLIDTRLSDQEVSNLQGLVQNLGNSPMATKLGEALRSLISPQSPSVPGAPASPPVTPTPSQYAGRSVPPSHSSNPVNPGVFGGRSPRRQPPAAAPPAAPPASPPPAARRDAAVTPLSSGPVASIRPNFERIHVSQNGNRLKSGGGDCGPAAAAMVLKQYGLLPEGMSDRDAILLVRRAAGVTSPRNGRWAVSEDEMARAVRALSGGRVDMKAKTPARDGADMRSQVQQALSQGQLPVIEVGSPYGGSGRHYMVAMEVKPNGNVVVADSGGRGHWEITPAELDRLVSLGNRRGGSMVMSYGT